MSSDHAFIALLGMLAAGVSGASLFFAFIYALVQATRHREPARWLALGLSLWILGFIASMTMNMVFSQYVGAADMGRIAMMTNLFRSCLHTVGLIFVVIAVFSDRDGVRRESYVPPTDVELGPRGNNPFSSPRTS